MSFRFPTRNKLLNLGAVLLLAPILAIAIQISISLPVMAQVATIFGGGVLISEALDEAEETATSLMEKGRTEADYLMFMFGHRMTGLIREARLQSEGLLDKTFESIDSERNAIFRQIDELFGLAQSDLAAATVKVDEVLSNVAQITAGVPFLDDSARLFSVSPAVLPPVDVETVVKFMGPNWGVAEAVAKLPDGTTQTLTTSREAEAYLKINPLTFAAASGDANFIEIEITYVKHPGNWYALWLNSQDGKVTVPLLVPRKVPGKVRLIETFERATVEGSTFEVTLNQIAEDHRGRHGVSVPPAQKEVGWTMDVAKLAEATTGGYKLTVTQWGHSGSCEGLILETLSRDGFAYQIWTGHTRPNAFNKDPGNQSCKLSVPLERTLRTDESLASEFFDLSWTAPVVLEVDPAAKARVVEYETPDGQRRQVTVGDFTSGIAMTQEPDGSLMLRPALPRGLGAL